MKGHKKAKINNIIESKDKSKSIISTRGMF
jgi:hypothetical protein